MKFHLQKYRKMSLFSVIYELKKNGDVEKDWLHILRKCQYVKIK